MSDTAKFDFRGLHECSPVNLYTAAWWLAMLYRDGDVPAIYRPSIERVLNPLMVAPLVAVEA